MIDHPQLEISLRGSGDDYWVDLRFRQPGSAADGPGRFGLRTRLPCGEAAVSPTFDPGYGERLTEALFGDPEVRSFFLQALAASAAPLRLRLLFAAADPCVHGLAWETLRHPQTGHLLATSESTVLSRSVGTPDWRPVTVGTREALRALVAVAAPPGLPPIDAAAEIDRARRALGDTFVEPPLVRRDGVGDGGAPGGGPRAGATFAALMGRLREGYDILHLVCHGAFESGEARLWLDGDDGRAALVSGERLVAAIAGLPRRPTLVALASCHSAAGAAAALGPALAAAGVPAVLAMHERVSQETVAAFMPVFFRELFRDGEIDRALAAARQAVADRHDAWMPVLFTRLWNGRLWEEGDPQLARVLDELRRLEATGQISAAEALGVLSHALGEELEAGTPRRQILQRLCRAPLARRRLLLAGEVSWPEVAGELLPTPADARRQQILVALRLGRDPVKEELGLPFVLVPPGRSPQGTLNDTPYYLAGSPVTETAWGRVMATEPAAPAAPIRVQVGVPRYEMHRFLREARRHLGEPADLDLPTGDQLRFVAEITHALTPPPGERPPAPVLGAGPASPLGFQGLTGVVYQLCRGPEHLYWWGGGYRSSPEDLDRGPLQRLSTSTVERSPDCGLRPLLRPGE